MKNFGSEMSAVRIRPPRPLPLPLSFSTQLWHVKARLRVHVTFLALDGAVTAAHVTTRLANAESVDTRTEGK